MGKRARKRAREAGEEPKKKQLLGDPGPYMVCRECGEPVSLFSYLHDRQDEFAGQDRLRYLHSMEYVDENGDLQQLHEAHSYDHEAIPVEGDPISADTICDFCSASDPRWVFVPRRPIRMLQGEVDGVPMEKDYSSPWNCCDGCLQAVRKKNLTRMLNRAMTSEHNKVLMTHPDHADIFRAFTRELYAKYIKSDPAGPYETKIRDDPKPLGRRGSARGI